MCLSEFFFLDYYATDTRNLSLLLCWNIFVRFFIQTLLRSKGLGQEWSKIQIDFTKPRPSHDLKGHNAEDDTIGFCQLVKYKNVQPYYEYYKHQRHDIDECKPKLRKSTYKGKKKKGRKL